MIDSQPAGLFGTLKNGGKLVFGGCSLEYNGDISSKAIVDMYQTMSFFWNDYSPAMYNQQTFSREVRYRPVHGGMCLPPEKG